MPIAIGQVPWQRALDPIAWTVQAFIQVFSHLLGIDHNDPTVGSDHEVSGMTVFESQPFSPERHSNLKEDIPDDLPSLFLGNPGALQQHGELLAFHELQQGVGPYPGFDSGLKAFLNVTVGGQCRE